ncbi:M23 family metallopeptidase [Homoserinibacter sp. YIM 151385]|uniref:M23 family metallopeptidase n=1 Tax=Homoserinibacter sp. YIM 151385 TaxID=2985506 RepID=UPI0022F11C00|nr:M23 family metallopeptidase [Homoserinibacter sp. YIM 151385]WBU37545.1 peptidoglycan DD-metalloendopeptidase family protein [Homoserinibacter sp. YIM 151385]
MHDDTSWGARGRTASRDRTATDRPRSTALRTVAPRGRARLIAFAAALILLPGLGVAAAPPAPAFAADYPSWSDVQRAVKKESNARGLIKQIRAQLAVLTEKAEKAQAEAEKRGLEFNQAQEAADEAAYKAEQLQTQADAAEKEARAAQKLAARLIAASAKVGGSDLTANLLGQGSSAATDDLLYKLGAMDKITSRSNGIYTEAVQLQNSAQSLSDQAVEAKDERDRRQAAAEKAMKKAQAASEAAAAAVTEQQANQNRMEQQLVVLAARRKATQKDYRKGLREQWGSGAAGAVSASGWARPASGYISSSYGMRLHPIYGYYKLHSGTDLAGQGCGAPIYAAHSGTVTYAGPNGDLGNYIQIQHPDGTSTGYGHIIAGGIRVGVGQQVGPGQNIARVGSTGGSTGCHLHFMVRIGGALTDPVPFMRARGVRLG